MHACMHVLMFVASTWGVAGTVHKLERTAAHLLQTSDEEEQLIALKDSVESLTATQARLETAVSAFSASLTAASTEAAQRDTSALPALIQQGRLQIESDEAFTQSLLREIVGNQNKVCRKAC